MDYDKNWYDSLIKPHFQPPPWLFTPVWAVLYILMGVSFSIIFFKPLRLINILAYFLFFTQLALNLSWTPVFFKYHQIKKAFFICFWLTITVLMMIIVFFHISKLAAVLLVPYFIWLLYACALNFAIWELNY